jgi:hypothetical protein
MDKNLFGGGNAQSLYTPMSDLEQEVVSRLIETGDLRVNVVGWGYFDKVTPSFGDLRVSIPLVLAFDRPEIPMPVRYFDLELTTGAGQVLFRSREAVEYNGQPLLVSAGMQITLIWDIAIKSMDPKLVKAILPGAVGLTSRLQDKDTGQFTLSGNMQLDSKAQQILRILRKGEQSVKQMSRDRLKKGV